MMVRIDDAETSHNFEHKSHSRSAITIDSRSANLQAHENSLGSRTLRVNLPTGEVAISPTRRVKLRSR